MTTKIRVLKKYFMSLPSTCHIHHNHDHFTNHIHHDNFIDHIHLIPISLLVHLEMMKMMDGEGSILSNLGLRKGKH